MVYSGNGGYRYTLLLNAELRQGTGDKNIIKDIEGNGLLKCVSKQTYMLQ